MSKCHIVGDHIPRLILKLKSVGKESERRTIFIGVKLHSRGYILSLRFVRWAFIIYCNCHRSSHAMHEISMKSNTGNFSIFYLSMDTRIVPIGALVFVLHALEMSSFI